MKFISYLSRTFAAITFCLFSYGSTAADQYREAPGSTTTYQNKVSDSKKEVGSAVVKLFKKNSKLVIGAITGLVAIIAALLFGKKGKRGQKNGKNGNNESGGNDQNSDPPAATQKGKISTTQENSDSDTKQADATAHIDQVQVENGSAIDNEEKKYNVDEIKVNEPRGSNVENELFFEEIPHDTVNAQNRSDNDKLLVSNEENEYSVDETKVDEPFIKQNIKPTTHLQNELFDKEIPQGTTVHNQSKSSKDNPLMINEEKNGKKKKQKKRKKKRDNEDIKVDQPRGGNVENEFFYDKNSSDRRDNNLESKLNSPEWTTITNDVAFGQSGPIQIDSDSPKDSHQGNINNENRLDFTTLHNIKKNFDGFEDILSEDHSREENLRINNNRSRVDFSSKETVGTHININEIPSILPDDNEDGDTVDVNMNPNELGKENKNFADVDFGSKNGINNSNRGGINLDKKSNVSVPKDDVRQANLNAPQQNEFAFSDLSSIDLDKVPSVLSDDNNEEDGSTVHIHINQNKLGRKNENFASKDVINRRGIDPENNLNIGDPKHAVGQTPEANIDHVPNENERNFEWVPRRDEPPAGIDFSQIDDPFAKDNIDEENDSDNIEEADNNSNQFGDFNQNSSTDNEDNDDQVNNIGNSNGLNFNINNNASKINFQENTELSGFNFRQSGNINNGNQPDRIQDPGDNKQFAAFDFEKEVDTKNIKAFDFGFGDLVQIPNEAENVLYNGHNARNVNKVDGNLNKNENGFGQDKSVQIPNEPVKEAQGVLGNGNNANNLSVNNHQNKFSKDDSGNISDLQGFLSDISIIDVHGIDEENKFKFNVNNNRDTINIPQYNVAQQGNINDSVNVNLNNVNTDRINLLEDNSEDEYKATIEEATYEGKEPLVENQPASANQNNNNNDNVKVAEDKGSQKNEKVEPLSATYDLDPIIKGIQTFTNDALLKKDGQEKDDLILELFGKKKGNNVSKLKQAIQYEKGVAYAFMSLFGVGPISASLMDDGFPTLQSYFADKEEQLTNKEGKNGKLVEGLILTLDEIYCREMIQDLNQRLQAIYTNKEDKRGMGKRIESLLHTKYSYRAEVTVKKVRQTIFEDDRPYQHFLSSSLLSKLKGVGEKGAFDLAMPNKPEDQDIVIKKFQSILDHKRKSELFRLHTLMQEYKRTNKKGDYILHMIQQSILSPMTPEKIEGLGMLQSYGIYDLAAVEKEVEQYIEGQLSKGEPSAYMKKPLTDKMLHQEGSIEKMKSVQKIVEEDPYVLNSLIGIGTVDVVSLAQHSLRVMKNYWYMQAEIAFDKRLFEGVHKEFYHLYSEKVAENLLSTITTLVKNNKGKEALPIQKLLDNFFAKRKKAYTILGKNTFSGRYYVDLPYQDYITSSVLAQFKAVTNVKKGLGLDVKNEEVANYLQNMYDRKVKEELIHLATGIAMVAKDKATYNGTPTYILQFVQERIIENIVSDDDGKKILTGFGEYFKGIKSFEDAGIKKENLPKKAAKEEPLLGDKEFVKSLQDNVISIIGSVKSGGKINAYREKSA